jgi:hypothetical protein
MLRPRRSHILSLLVVEKLTTGALYFEFCQAVFCRQFVLTAFTVLRSGF